jgi:transcription elongation GreA/GreB family factor
MIDILPHELKLLQARRAKLRDRLTDLAADKSEAQGPAYDWHDNAPLDVIERELSITNGLMRAIEDSIDQSTVVDYPKPDETQVKLGSLVVAKLNSVDTAFVLVGQNATGTNTYDQKWTERHPAGFIQDTLKVITPASPLGAVALNAVVGQDIHYQGGNNKSITATILTVNQQWVHEQFSETK